MLPTLPNRNILDRTDRLGLDRVVVLPLRNGVDAGQAARLLTPLAEVEYVEPNHVFHADLLAPPNDSLYSTQWAHAAMDVLEAWKYTKGDTSVKIGFVDTGVQWDHPDLIGQFAVNAAEDINHNGLFDAWPSTEQHPDAYGHIVSGDLDGIDQDGNGYADDVIGYDFVDQSSINFGDASGRDPIPYDEHYVAHGTAIAGVIAAKANNSIGVAGIAPQCRLVALRALDATGNGETDDIASAIIYAADNGVRILNLSFGDYFASLLMRDAIRYATRNGVLVVASSGNDGNDLQHYPSDFSECLAVGMTAVDNLGNEVLSSRSSFGEGMDLIAPGSSIQTTGPSGSYQYISGTSFSAPATAAVAGLLLSHHPSLSNTELRSILESTTDRLSAHGYDHTHANGRVNARRALEFVGSASIKILSPMTDDEFILDSTYTIVGSAASAQFRSYTVSVAAGLNPDRNPAVDIDWIPIDSESHQVLGSALAIWKPTALVPGVYTLRLAVHTSDLRSVEERVTIRIRDHRAFAASFAVDTMFQNEKRVLLVHGRADSLTRAILNYRSVGTQRWSAVQDDIFGHGHAMLLSTEEVSPGMPIELSVVLRTNAGDSVTFPFVAGIPAQSISQSDFTQKPYTLPSGFLLDTLLTSGSTRYAVQNIASSSVSFGMLGAFEFDTTAKRFVQVDSLSVQALPRGVGNVSGRAGAELLLQGFGGTSFLYRGNAAHPVFGEMVFADTTSTPPFFATSLVDLDGDGISELVGRQEYKLNGAYFDRYDADKILGRTRTQFGTLPDTTPPAPHYGSNTFSTPETRAADFYGDRHTEIVFLDDDADLVIDAFDPMAPDKFRTTFVDLNDGFTEGRNFAVGDFNGDGRPDLALAYHPSYDYNDDLEIDAPYWTVKVLLNNGDRTFREGYVDRFYPARSNSPYRSSVGAIKNVTGGVGDNLVLSFFPNFYLLAFDNASGSMKPLWQYPVANSPRGALAYDFDGNGRLEFGFDTGDSIRFFERVSDFTTRASPPAGLEVIPRDSNRIDLHWSPVSDAIRYYILRANNEPNAPFDVIDSTSTVEYSDLSVENQTGYLYAVETNVPTNQLPVSVPCPAVFGYAHPTPRVVVVAAKQAELTLKSTQPLSFAALSGGEFSYDDSLLFSTAAISGDSTLVLIPQASSISAGAHQLRIRSFALRDAWNSPFDTSGSVSWQQSPISVQDRFYIVRWNFESTGVHIYFSMRPDDNALVPSNYLMTPFGEVLSARRDPLDDSAVFVTLTVGSSLSPINPSGTPLSPIGASYTLCVQNVTSGGIPLESDGNCAGETPVAAELSHLFTYPSPVRESDLTMTFAGLTPQANVIIYTAGMRLLRRLETVDQTGGVQWDLRDETGRRLPSGVYLYHVTGKNELGQDVTSAEGKFVIVRDR